MTIHREKYRGEQTWRSGCSGQAQVRVDFTHVQFDTTLPELSPTQPAKKLMNHLIGPMAVIAGLIYVGVHMGLI